MEFTEKFVAFVDVLGFEEMVRSSESGKGTPLSEIMEILGCLGKGQGGPLLCPAAARVKKDLDFQVTQISDCAIVSAEVSPAGVINLVGHCWGAVITLLALGVLCRGYITKGSVYHAEGQVIGTGYMAALRAEKTVSAFKRLADERGTPFVEVDSVVADYARNCSDRCVKDMFDRQVASDGNVTALFPFKRLSHSFIITGFGRRFDPNDEKRANDNLRKGIQLFKDRIVARIDNANSAAVAKAEHYLSALDAQLEQCDRTDKAIDDLGQPIAEPVRNIWRRDHKL